MRTNSKEKYCRGNSPNNIITNRGYDESVFAVSKTTKEVALLPGIGRFCLCGCNRRIEGKHITQKTRRGDTIQYFKRPREDQLFYSNACRCKHYRHNEPKYKEYLSRLDVKINLKVIYDKTPYRILKIYLKHQSSIDIKITEKQNPELWNICEKFARYRSNNISINKELVL